ncbi:MAG TPA: lipid II flippase MurJ, partial [Thermoanaerobaculia bacterium]
GINTINSVIATRFASSLGEAGVSRFYYANRLKELVLGGFAVSLATAILPLLARQALAPDRGPFKGNVAFALRLITFVTVPATVGLVLLRVPIVGILFEGGRFRPADTYPTADVLASLAAGLVFFAGVRVLVPAFYALKETRLPVYSAVADCATFVLLCVLLTPRFGLPGIGFAASAAGAVNALILFVMLRLRQGRLRGREIAISTARIVLAGGAMGAALVAGRSFLAYDSWRGALGATRLAATILVAALLYWFIAAGLGAPEPAELRNVARRRVRRSAP